MIRLSPQLRAGIQRSTLPALILLSGAIVLIGKTDQTMFDTLRDRKSTRLNSSHANISYAVFCLKKKTQLSESRRHLRHPGLSWPGRPPPLSYARPQLRPRPPPVAPLPCAPTQRPPASRGRRRGD